MIKLADIASVIRSKNSGPGELTLDIIFKNPKIYEKAVLHKLINKKIISTIYHIDEGNIISIIEFKPANAIKITMKRRFKSGDPEDSDIYGAQQHAPLLGLEFTSI